MHLLEYLGLLAAYLEPHSDAELAKVRGDVLERLAALRAVGYHHHVEISPDDRLRDLQYVYSRLCEIRADSRQDANGVLADYGDYYLLHGCGYYPKNCS